MLDDTSDTLVGQKAFLDRLKSSCILTMRNPRVLLSRFLYPFQHSCGILSAFYSVNVAKTASCCTHFFAEAIADMQYLPAFFLSNYPIEGFTFGANSV